MLVLAIEQSASPCSAAVTRDGSVLADVSWVPDGFRNQQLFSLVPELLAQAAVQPADVDAFALGCGPGAFSALRIAAAYLSALAGPGGKPALGVPSCEATAVELAAKGAPAPLTIVGDARRNRLWHARFQPGPTATDVLVKPTLAPASTLREILEGTATVASPDWDRVQELIREATDASMEIVKHNAAPHAATVARLAEGYLRSGEACPPVPIYLTPPTAAKPRFA